MRANTIESLKFSSRLMTFDAMIGLVLPRRSVLASMILRDDEETCHTRIVISEDLYQAEF